MVLRFKCRLRLYCEGARPSLKVGFWNKQSRAETLYAMSLWLIWLCGLTWTECSQWKNRQNGPRRFACFKIPMCRYLFHLYCGDTSENNTLFDDADRPRCDIFAPMATQEVCGIITSQTNSTSHFSSHRHCYFKCKRSFFPIIIQSTRTTGNSDFLKYCCWSCLNPFFFVFVRPEISNKQHNSNDEKAGLCQKTNRRGIGDQPDVRNRMKL